MRLDAFLFENGFYSSRTKAAQAICDFAVEVNGKIVTKPSFSVSQVDIINIIKQQKFVSLGGYKLDKALEDFGYSVQGKTCCDIGASTGGFTDCLLMRGANKVYAVDVGCDQLDQKLKNDKRVVVIDGLNARDITVDSFEACDLAVCDCSFISLKLVIEPIFRVIKTQGALIALIKPQFECFRNDKSKNGIVLDKKLQLGICEGIYDYVLSCSLIARDFTVAPIRDKTNVEYLIMISRQGELFPKDKIKSIIFD